jgi:SAM-dependent methyltransferase
MNQPSSPVDAEVLRAAIRDEYEVVAREPTRGFHFHTGRLHAARLDYEPTWLDGIPDSAIDSFAGTGSPFRLGALAAGERVLDLGSGAGMDSLIASRMVGPEGRVVGIDMTPAMIERAREGAEEMRATNVDFREGLAEAVPLPDGWADVIISNGVFNLFPDKPAALAEMARVLGPGGRLQIADILLERAVPENAKERIELWTG